MIFFFIWVVSGTLSSRAQRVSQNSFFSQNFTTSVIGPQNDTNKYKVPSVFLFMLQTFMPLKSGYRASLAKHFTQTVRLSFVILVEQYVFM